MKLDSIKNLNKTQLTTNSEIIPVFNEIEEVLNAKIDKGFSLDEQEVARLKGEKGDTGNDGKDGTNGLDGEKGDEGDKGDKGDNGKDGTNGKDGVDGLDGIDGKDGKDGVNVTSERIIETIISSPVLIPKEKVEGLADIERIAKANTNGSSTTFVNGKLAKNINFTGATVAYSGDNANVIVTSSQGSGDVVGPASAVDSNFASFDTTTGKLIKDSGSKASDFAVALGADDNYVTDAQLVVIGNTSGTNTGDQTITNSSNATSHTVTLSASGGSIQLVEGSNITLTTTGTATDGVVTIASTTSGGVSGQATVNFGAVTQEDSIAKVTVATASALTASIILVSPAGVATADHDADDYQWDNISGYVSTIVNGVSFDIIGVAPEGSWGDYKFNYSII